MAAFRRAGLGGFAGMSGEGSSFAFHPFEERKTNRSPHLFLTTRRSRAAEKTSLGGDLTTASLPKGGPKLTLPSRASPRLMAPKSARRNLRAAGRLRPCRFRSTAIKYSTSPRPTGLRFLGGGTLLFAGSVFVINSLAYNSYGFRRRERGSRDPARWAEYRYRTRPSINLVNSAGRACSRSRSSRVSRET